jgi:hypothetical protein
MSQALTTFDHALTQSLFGTVPAYETGYSSERLNGRISMASTICSESAHSDSMSVVDLRVEL